MKYLLLIAAIMTLTSARTISSNDADCCGGGACCPGACCMTMTRYFGQFGKGPRRETGGASFCILYGAVTLSEALQEKTKHESRLSPSRIVFIGEATWKNQRFFASLRMTFLRKLLDLTK